MPIPFQQLTRLPEWWQAKAGNLLGVIYLVVAFAEIPFTTTLWYIGPALLTIVGIGGFGHFVNDWLDIDTDLRAGKPNRVADLRTGQRLSILLALLLVAFLPWLILPQDQWSWTLLFLEFGLLVIYALPPFRLKERAFLGVLADGWYAYAIPALLAAYTFFLIAGQAPDWWFLMGLFGWQSIVGIHNILIHQVVDYENDRLSGTQTLATKWGQKKISLGLTYGVWPLECLSFLALLIYLSFSWFEWYFLLPVLLLVLRYGSLFRVSALRVFAKSVSGKDRQLLNIHYHRFWPFWNLILAAALVNAWYLLLLLIHILAFYLNQLWTLGSLTVNYSIYYYRRWVLREDVRTALREHYEPSGFEQATAQNWKKSQQADLGPPKPTIALFNRNQNKYTETFVRQHVEHLPFRVVPMYGDHDYWPIKKANGKLLYAPKPYQLKSWWNKTVLGLDEEDLKIKAIQSYLMAERVQVILAEFGTVGATVLPLATDLRLPMVVIFYGYDAFNQAVLDKLRTPYTELFAYASVLIGVSQDICQQLQKLGAPADKVHYLPCALNLSLFQFTTHHQNPPVFLSVGRFAETKSPHLTILAFAQVVQEVPEARLVMIGKDGGGELFEACHILVRALQLEDKVEFKGILLPWEVYEEMQKARIFVQHSVTTPLNGDKEGTPVAIMEAMACGLPVVSTRHAGIAEMIEHEKTGLLVDEYDVDGMAKAMRQLIREKEFAHQLAQQAAQYIRNHDLVKNHHVRLAEIIQGCV